MNQAANLWEVLGALVFVLALIVLCAGVVKAVQGRRWASFLRRSGAAVAPPGRAAVLETVVLDSRSRLVRVALSHGGEHTLVLTLGHPPLVLKE
ncbi:MAG: hypothetical protein ACK5O9_04180 [Holosporales bacterium]|jgi:flagellar biogenesis protein FliO